MKQFFTLALLVVLAASGWAQSRQVLLLANGAVAMPANAADMAQSFKPDRDQLFAGRYYMVVQFASIPLQGEKEAMQREGLRFLGYLPHDAYIVSIPQGYALATLVGHGARSFMVPNDRLRLSPELFRGRYPSWALSADGKLDVVVQTYSDILPATVATDLGKYFEVVSEQAHPRKLRLRVETSRLYHLLQFPYIAYIEPVAPASTPDDYAGRSLHRSNAINTDYSAGRHYDGTGMTVGLADDGTLGPHIDRQGRLTDFSTSNTGNHGDMTSGIFFGAGNREPKVRGHASGAYCYYWDIGTYTHIVDAVAHWNTYGVILTSTSYSQGTGGMYTTDAEFIDDQIYNNRQLEHVFSAGNAGTADHGYGAGPGWANITGGYKAAKSVITCGDMNNSGVLESTSSRGPTNDGRTKPDICANGFGQLSTDENNTTQTGSGTSAAAPSIAGTVTQLYHAYKSLNGGQNPESALIKACVLNTGNEAGNAGPDYQYGWGQINALRAVRLLEGHQYWVDSVTQGQTRTSTITVPANTSELRVMVYWTDPAGNPAASKALVNDLNIQLTAGSAYLPWRLDPTPTAAALGAPATRGVDTLNNMEQVTIPNPPAGNATLTVNGFAVPQGPQRYWVVYEFVTPYVEMTYPIGGEGFVPGEVEKLRWDAAGVTGSFTLEYSTNNGSSWTNIATNVSNALRYYNWTVPATVTGQALVRVTSGAYTDASEANFAIANLPTNLVIDYICPDSIGLHWTAAAGATGYEVSILGAKYMDSVSTTTGTSAVIYNQNPSIEHWYSVRSLVGSSKGRRAIAINHAAGTFNCTIPVDMQLTQIGSPASGSLPSCQTSATMPVTIQIKNNGTGPASNIPVHYVFNGGSVQSETFAGPLASGASATHTFATTVNMAALGTYTLDAWTGLVGDGNSYNDTLHQSTTVLTGTVAPLPVTQNFESFSTCGTASDCGATVCPLGLGWENYSNGVIDDIDWRVSAGATPSTGTGPNVDHTLGTAAGKYVYLEASTCFGAEAQLLSPCIDLSGTLSPQLTFWRHMEGTGMGELHIDVLSNGVWYLDVVSPYVGASGANWVYATVNLSPFIGSQVNVRFRGITGATFASDMALDDIGIVEASAPPVAGFVGSPLNTCPGNTVTFTDQSINSPTTWAWSITPSTFSYVGGTSASSQNPQVQFSAPGTYTVTLVATNAFGNNTSTQTNYVTITNGNVPAIVEDFEGSFVPTGWSLATAGGALTWAQSITVTGSSGTPTKAAYVENFTLNNVGAEDKLITMPIDLTSQSVASMTFDVAYARYSATLFDGLRVEVSTDCGATWPNIVYNKSDSVLATVADQGGNWFPANASDWRNESVSLSAFAGQRIVIRFVNVNGFGNNLFVDNVNILGIVGVNPGLAQLGLQVWPNPANGLFQVALNALPDSPVTLQVQDLAGRKIWQNTVTGNGGTWQGQMDLRALAKGIYYLRVETEGYRGVKKLVIE